MADIVRELTRRQPALSIVGANDVGQLGAGVVNASGSASISTVSGMKGKYGPFAVAAGSSHGAFLARDGNVMVWGDGGSGQLGVGEAMECSPRPYLLKALRKEKAVSVACGAAHTLVALDDGRVFSFGDGSGWGELGTGHLAQAWEPVEVAGLPSGRGPASVFAGRVSSGCLYADGSCFAWGCNSVGQLGLPIAEGGEGDPAEAHAVLTPTEVPFDPALGLGSSRVVAAAAGDFFTLFVVGSSRVAVLAGSPIVPRSQREASISGDTSWLLASELCQATSEAGLGLRWVRESPFSGKTGDPSEEDAIAEPEKPLTAIVDVSAGDRHGCVVRATGQVYMLGRGVFGLERNAMALLRSRKAGHAEEDGEEGSEVGASWVASELAVQVPALGLEGVVSSSCGAAHTVLGTRTGRLLAFGQSDYGQTGTGEFGWTRLPEPCEALLVPMKHVEAFACGGGFTCAIHFPGARGEARERLLATTYGDLWMRKCVGRGLGEKLWAEGEAEEAVDDLAAQVAKEEGLEDVVVKQSSA